MMKAGFYTIMAAQFFSSLADNALLIAAIALLRDLNEPSWMTPALKQCFVLSYVLLAPLVGAFADSMPKGQVMLITNGVKVVGCVLMLFTLHPLAAYAVVGFGAAALGAASSFMAPTMAANFSKNCVAMERAVESIRREPSMASLPPTWASTS